MRIAFVGKAGSGKTTSARYLEELGWTRLSFAQSVREVVQYLWGIDTWRFKTEVGRTLLQKVGTDAIRAIDEDVWVRLLIERVTALPVATNMAIDDVRFPNEAAALKANGFKIIQLQRTGDTKTTLTPEQTAHASETAQDVIVPDATIVASTLNQLLDQVKAYNTRA